MAETSPEITVKKLDVAEKLTGAIGSTQERAARFKAIYKAVSEAVKENDGDAEAKR